MITKEKIKEKYQDIAGRWRIIVDIGNGECQMFKFQKEPQLAEIDAELQKFIQNQQTSKLNKLETINQEIVRLQTRKAELEAIK